MQSSPAIDSGEVCAGEGSIAEMLNTHISEALTPIKNGKFVLPSLKRVMDAILLQVATEINYSSTHPYHLISAGVRNQDRPLTEEDILAGGCCFPHMDCVGSAYIIRRKIITTFKKFDIDGTIHIKAFTNHSCVQIGKIVERAKNQDGKFHRIWDLSFNIAGAGFAQSSLNSSEERSSIQGLKPMLSSNLSNAPLTMIRDPCRGTLRLFEANIPNTRILRPLLPQNEEVLSLESNNF